MFLPWESLDSIDWGDPLRDHPLNQGLSAWYLAGPNQTGWGTSLWRNIVRNDCHGVLTNMELDEWSFTAEFGQAGYVQPNFTDEYIAAHPIGTVTLQHPFWLAQIEKFSSYSGITGFGNTSTNNVIVGFDFRTASKGFIRANDNSGPSAFGSATGHNDNALHLFHLISYSATNHQLWVDGKLSASSTTSVGTITANRFVVGGLIRTGAFEQVHNAGFASVAYGIGKAPNPVQYYKEAISRWPNTLRRIKLQQHTPIEAAPPATTFPFQIYYGGLI